MRRCCATVAVRLAAARLFRAVAAPVADLAEVLAPIRARHAVPALGAAVLVDGQLVALASAASAAPATTKWVTVDDRWHLGSCTKAMTATLLARLVDAGKLQWTTTVAAGLFRSRRRDARSGAADHAHAVAHASFGLARRAARRPCGTNCTTGSAPRAAREAVARRFLLASAPEAAPGARFPVFERGLHAGRCGRRTCRRCELRS